MKVGGSPGVPPPASDPRRSEDKRSGGPAARSAADLREPDSVPAERSGARDESRSRCRVALTWASSCAPGEIRTPNLLIRRRKNGLALLSTLPHPTRAPGPSSALASMVVPALVSNVLAGKDSNTPARVAAFPAPHGRDVICSLLLAFARRSDRVDTAARG